MKTLHSQVDRPFELISLLVKFILLNHQILMFLFHFVFVEAPLVGLRVFDEDEIFFKLKLAQVIVQAHAQ